MVSKRHSEPGKSRVVALKGGSYVRGFRLCLGDEVFQQTGLAIAKRAAASVVERPITSYRHSERVSGAPIATGSGHLMLFTLLRFLPTRALNGGNSAGDSFIFCS